MKITTLLHDKYGLKWLCLTFSIASLLVGCQPQVEEKIPDIISITNAPDLQQYVLEFSKPVPSASPGPIVTKNERKEPPLPVDHSLIQGKVFYVDHNTNCFLWLMQSYTGSNWWERQRLYVYSEKTKELQEMNAFAHKEIEEGFVLSDKDCAELFLVTSVSRCDDYSPWADELWTYTMRNKEWKRISIGGWIDISPDRSKVAFWKSSKEIFWLWGGGFHCLYLWDIKSGQIEPIISMWESDPGSGPGWDYRWAADSKAIHFSGNCGGFYKNEKRRYTELNLIYLVKDKKMFSVEHH